MKGGNMKGGMRRPVFGSIAAATLIALSASPTRAQQPPAAGCRKVSKVEYDSAKENYLLRNKFGAYVRTGNFLRAYYWYCHL
jgi:hypothetical protein